MSILLAAFSLPSAAELALLSGSSGTPNSFIDTAISPTNAGAEWEFRTDGSVWQLKDNAADAQFQSGIEWHPSPDKDYWIRATYNAGDANSSGDSLSTWLKLAGAGAANRSWKWTETTNGFATTDGSVKVEIATDAGGSNIVATGYYRGIASVEL